MSANRRVVITGVGVITSIGMDAAAFWDGLARGACGVRTIKAFDPSPLATRFAGEIDGFDPKKYLSKEGRKQIRVMARSIQLAVASAQLAIDDGKVDKSKLDPTRFGVEYGAGLIPSELTELGEASYLATGKATHPVDVRAWGEKIRETIQPLWMLKYLPNMLACHVSILHDAQGPNNSITESDAASLLALGEATRILRRNQADFFLVGGADSKINPLSQARQQVFGRLSRNNEDPVHALKPFDKRRDGLVIGEGGCTLVTEELEHAQKRGASIVAEVAGFGSSFDRGLTGKGLARAIRFALGQAGITPNDIDHVNAQGLGSPDLDAFEARAINEVFGTAVPVWTIKPNIGHLGAGSGVTELAGSLLAMKHGTLPGTLNYETPDPACPIQVQTKARAIGKPYFVKVGFTEMGQCAAVVCKKW
ncbi:MAG TPA: beta-ketoacyl-[acyl-carrier-protein] synthase family protein [Gemmataceae bacterium]|nr:beta-ketoacyl-[acyl-carrier-protein] synthase family protein [Gemmataceae bacterium]